MSAQAQAAGHLQISDWWTIKTGPPAKVGVRPEVYVRSDDRYSGTDQVVCCRFFLHSNAFAVTGEASIMTFTDLSQT